MTSPEEFIPQLHYLPVTAALGGALLHLAVGAAALAASPQGEEDGSGGVEPSGGALREGKGRGGNGNNSAGAPGGDWSGAAAAVALTHLGCGICGFAAVRAAAGRGGSGAGLGASGLGALLLTASLSAAHFRLTPTLSDRATVPPSRERT